MRSGEDTKRVAESAERLKAVFRSAIDGIITIDRRGIMESVNDSAATLFGYSREEMVGNNVSMLMPEPDRSQHDGYISRYLETGIPRVIGIGREVTGRRNDGSLFPFRLSLSVVELPDNILFTGVVHDISEIKRAEEQLRALNTELEARVLERTDQLTEAVNRLLQTNRDLKREVEERRRAEYALQQSQEELRRALDKEKDLNELKSKFVTLASHEFRTPLGTILSSASLIARYADSSAQDRREKHIGRIRSAVQNLNGILDDFLSLGKLEEGRIEPRPEPVRPGRTL